jgi:cysteinyl-tRNA synthetase
MVKLFNTLTRKKEEFAPREGKTVGLYTCGPTVYQYAHLGNLRIYIFEDILKRTLLINDYRVHHVMNITDVGHLTSDADEGEDKIEVEARREKKSAWDIARFYENIFKQDIASLNILPPDTWCRATEHIEEQISLVRRLEKNGYTYRTSDGIYFDTTQFPAYGKLAEKNIAGIQAGARVEQGEKCNPTDFALWKFSPAAAGHLAQKREMQWDSPWGTGFPGWHLECSAMSMKYLGETIDIHCGGIDHIQIHHTNEIAQSEGATGKPFVRYWLHGNFLLAPRSVSEVEAEGDKMAKSKGNFLTLNDIKEHSFDPLDFRYFALIAHYRSPLTFSWEALEAAKSARKNLAIFLQEMREKVTDKIIKKHDEILHTYQTRFLHAVNDDLAMPQALSILWELVSEARKPAREMGGPAPSAASVLNTFFWFDHVLGLNLKKASEEKEVAPPEIVQLAREREAKRAAGDFAGADTLRKEIQTKGWQIKDTPKGPKPSRGLTSS